MRSIWTSHSYDVNCLLSDHSRRTCVLRDRVTYVQRFRIYNDHANREEQEVECHPLHDI